MQQRFIFNRIIIQHKKFLIPFSKRVQVTLKCFLNGFLASCPSIYYIQSYIEHHNVEYFCSVSPCAGRLGFPHPGGDNPLPLNGMYGKLPMVVNVLLC